MNEQNFESVTLACVTSKSTGMHSGIVILERHAFRDLSAPFSQ